MSRFLSETARTITPYTPGEQPKDRKFIKLNTNENPYPPAPGVIDALKSVTGTDAKLYPDPDASLLRRTVAAYHTLEVKQVFVGNGSDEVLAMMFPAYYNRTDRIAFPDITYSFYPVYAELYGIPYVTIPLDENFEIDFTQYPRDLKSILFANPNAPTSVAVSAERIEALLKDRPDTLIVVDEAYVDFGAESVIPLIDLYDNLLVIQTMSKSRSLAGMRVGLAFGDPALIEGLERIKNSFNSYTLDVAAQRAAKAAYDDEVYFKMTRSAIMATRGRAVTALEEIGMKVLPSGANFVFATLPGHSGADLQQYLRDNGVLVRRFAKPRIADWLRITIGTDEEMDAVIHLVKMFQRSDRAIVDEE